VPLKFNLSKASQVAYAAVGVAVFVCCFFFKQYTADRNAKIFVERWVAANYVALQEGNFLEEIAKLERVLSAQIDVSGIVLRDLRSPAVPLMAMGDVDVVPKEIWQNITVAPRVWSCGILKPCVAVRLPGLGGNLALVLIADNGTEVFSLLGFVAVITALIMAGLVITSWQYRRANRETLVQISDAFSTAIKNDPKSIKWDEFREILGDPLNQTFGELRDKIEKSAGHEATARMTQMLAHDVRKPFSILRMGLGMLANAKDPDGVKKVLARLIPEIDKAVSSVDGLIADVMEVGSTSTKLSQEPANPESLIEATLGEIFRVYPKANVAISYDLQHTHMANVHVQKVGRVFSNIVGNAIQAMGQTGEIWFKTRERADMIEFCIGNAGSLIPAASLHKLFDAFFTSGKKGGTGLGLAIAEKVVKAHGGRIWCESDKTPSHPTGYVEFKFTLPLVASGTCKSKARLPAHSTELIAGLLTFEDSAAEQGSVDKSELTLEEEIIRASNKLGRQLRVLLVDDEAIYRGALGSYLSRTPELSAAMSVILASSSREALAETANGSIDLVITDVDMGEDSLDGFELVASMRAAGMQALICVHSNRIVAADHKTATIGGADAFLPKPVARAQLLRLVLQAAQASQQARQSKRQGVVAEPASKPEILVVDDNIFVLEAWQSALAGDAIVHSIASLEDLDERLEADPGFAGRLLLAVTDMHLDGSAGDGLDVGRLLKRHRPGLQVLLSSDGVIPPSELVGAVDMAIGKDPVRLATLSALCSNSLSLIGPANRSSYRQADVKDTPFPYL